MRVQVVQEVVDGDGNSDSSWRLCFQWCNYVYDDGSIEQGYRFIWRRPDGSLQPARGQARIPSIAVARDLMRRAEESGWGNNEG